MTTDNDYLIERALRIEFFLLSINFIANAILWYLVKCTSQYHANLSFVVIQIPTQYFFSLLARMFIIYQQLNEPNLDVLLNDRYFLFAVWLRNSLLFVAFYCAPFFVIERVFATYHIKDYEEKDRSYIGYLIVALLYIYSFVSAQFYMFDKRMRIVQIYLISACNCLAFLTSILLNHINKKRYINMRTNLNKTYSLSTRIQIAENITSTRPIMYLCIFVSIFATISSSILHSDDMIIKDHISWTFILFNYCCWAYGTFVPIFLLTFNDKWRKELKRIQQLVLCRSNRITSSMKKRNQRVRDTFGNNCYVHNSRHADVYFSQLNTNWK